MEIIIDVSGRINGGGLQVAISFIYECRAFCANQYHILLGSNAVNQVCKEDFGSNFVFYDILNMPFYKRNSFLRRIEAGINPDVVFSVFGPTYFKSKAIRVSGFAIGHYIYPESPYWKIISFKERIKFSFKKIIHLLYLKSEADYIITETEDATQRIKQLLGDNKGYFTVPNTCSHYFNDFIPNTEELMLPERKEGDIRLLSLCNYYKHKNIHTIPKVLDFLYAKGIKNIFFILTIKHSDYIDIIEEKYRNNVINIGNVDMSSVPQLYSECDFAFVPTLLECFTANYPEAMVMMKPILTSDLPFARTICSDAAIYFDPSDYSDIAEKIIMLIGDKLIQNLLIQNGINRLTYFPSSEERARKYLEICNYSINNKL